MRVQKIPKNANVICERPLTGKKLWILNLEISSLKTFALLEDWRKFSICGCFSYFCPTVCRKIHSRTRWIHAKKTLRLWSGSFFTYICSHFTTAYFSGLQYSGTQARQGHSSQLTYSILLCSSSTHVYVISTETEAKISHGSINFPLLPPLRNN